jgi:hypothetical protein
MASIIQNADITKMVMNGIRTPHPADEISCMIIKGNLGKPKDPDAE